MTTRQKKRAGMARLFLSFRYNSAREHYLVAVVLDPPASGVALVLVPPPVAAGFLSQPVVNAAKPHRTSNVQIFFII